VTVESAPDPVASTSELDDGLGPGIDHPDEALAAVVATRRLIAALRISDAPADVLDRVAALADEAAALLEPHTVEGVYMQGALRPKADDPGPDRFDTDSKPLDQPGRFFPFSPIIGEWNPIAPPAALRWDGEHIEGTATFGASHAGPPGMVHGGVIALLFDEVLGCANMCAGVGGFTGTLTVRYERPTPLHAGLELESHIETVEGRKITTKGTITHDGQVTARAEGLFIRVST
jgi:acyl-coenzyme A thioesterase PaaI-like protein